MVFVPTTAAQLQRWRAGAAVDAVGFAAVPAMLAAHDFGADELEDAEFVALGYASVASLLSAAGTGSSGSPVRSRWVAAVETAGAPEEEAADFGLVRVSGARWARLSAVFVDEPAAADAVAALARTLGGRELTEALTEDTVLDFVAEHQLLWHLPQELDALL